MYYVLINYYFTMFKCTCKYSIQNFNLPIESYQYPIIICFDVISAWAKYRKTGYNRLLVVSKTNYVWMDRWMNESMNGNLLFRKRALLFWQVHELHPVGQSIFKHAITYKRAIKISKYEHKVAYLIKRKLTSCKLKYGIYCFYHF